MLNAGFYMLAYVMEVVLFKNKDFTKYDNNKKKRKKQMK